jgi:hypothetical protein
MRTEPSRPFYGNREARQPGDGGPSEEIGQGPGMDESSISRWHRLGAHAQSVLILERRTPEHLKVTTLRGASMMG